MSITSFPTDDAILLQIALMSKSGCVSVINQMLNDVNDVNVRHE